MAILESNENSHPSWKPYLLLNEETGMKRGPKGPKKAILFGKVTFN